MSTEPYADRPESNGDGSEPRQAIGSYRILRELGRGGQGTVYLAEDAVLARTVALKVLEGLGPVPEQALSRFRREALVASRLQDPGICTVFEARIDARTPYIAMQYVEGSSLAQRIASAWTAGPGAELPPTFVELDGNDEPITTIERPAPARRAAAVAADELERVVDWFERAARSLHAAHEAGVIHRDIKPANIMIAAAGHPVILDFGLARADEGDFGTLTRTGDLFGTPAYMSPEQLTRGAVRLDRRTDVYSLGATLYECLTLRRPFEAPTREGLYQKILTEDPVAVRRWNPSVSRDLEVIVDTALHKDRDRRYATALALAEDLRRARNGEPILARPLGLASRLFRRARRQPARATLIAVLAIGIPAFAVLMAAYAGSRADVESARLARLGEQKDEILAEASIRLTEGEPRAALPLYGQAAAMEGGSAEAVAGLALAHLALGAPDAALRALDGVNGPRLEGAAGTHLRIEVLRALHRDEEARVLEAQSAGPEAFVDWLVLALQEFRRASRADIARFRHVQRLAIRAVLESARPRLFAMTLYAKASANAKDREASIDAAAILERRWPASPTAQFCIGLALDGWSEPELLDKAEAAYRECLRLRPDSPTAWDNLGLLYEKRNRGREARDAFRKAIALAPGFAKAHGSLSRVTDDPEEAVAAAREAVRLAPAQANLHCMLGIALEARGDFEAALAEYREGIRLDPADPRSCEILGSSLVGADRAEEAIEVYAEAIRSGLDGYSIQANLGAAQDRVGAREEAIRAFETALALADRALAASPDPRELHLAKSHVVLMHLALGRLLVDSGRTEDGLDHLRQALKLDIRDEFAAYTLGMTLAGVERFDDAIGAMRNAIAIKPDFAQAHWDLGGILQSVGRYPEMLEERRRGHELGSKRRDGSESSGAGLADAQRLCDLEPVLDRWLAASDSPESARDLFKLAPMALAKGRVAKAARWFREGYEQAPELGGGTVGPLAAGAAVAMAFLQGEDAPPDETSRSEWRALALSWLDEQLSRLSDAAAQGRTSALSSCDTLVKWKASPRFAPIRDSEALRRLPEEERAAWRAFWGRVDDAFAAADAARRAR